MRVGVIMMALALALVIAAAVVSVALRSEPERLVAAEVAAKSPGEAPRYSSGEEVSATKKSSSEKESSHYPSGGVAGVRILLWWRWAAQGGSQGAAGGTPAGSRTPELSVRDASTGGPANTFWSVL